MQNQNLNLKNQPSQNRQPEGEEWKDIPNYEGLYQVSNLGRVKSLARGNKKERIRIPAKARNGYLYIVLSKNGVQHTIRIHRVVAEQFIPNPNNYETVNHKDFDKNNNSCSNLEWMPMGDNIRHAKDNSIGNNKPVLQYTLDGEFVREWHSAYRAGKELGFTSELISKCCRGKQHEHKGFIWKFKQI